MPPTPPRYAEVADVLRKRIKEGAYQPGDLLPSTHELCRMFDISVQTAKSAIAQLRGEGLVYAKQGKGVFVRERREILRYTGGRYGHGRPPNLQEEEDSGIFLDVDAERRQVEASPGVAARLKIQPGDKCSEAVYTWHLDGEPVMVSTQWEPLALTGGTPIETPASGERGQPDVISRYRSIGINVTEIQEDIRTRMPTPDEARVLKLTDGTPVFHITRTHLAGELPVETAEIVMRGDSFVLRNRQTI
ncbi:GntR family transcriptional regulator [Actinomadura rubrobrunea]|uniref:GntR family transcriptional regulator n=1 Tax=Actinomadura rubrobrunea TaxID=115335 RepID=A0A9W6PZM0_9ACTN|nr:GntR family transcriptional regulator [Actinomadura rubrobrunea]GLW65934.1 GntR family transcriptional regulator [Actinomadura rubrobrunea]